MDAATLAQLRLAVRRYVRERLVPLEAQVAASDCIPDAVHKELAELGLNGMSIPERYGGLGLDMASEIELAFELGWTSPAFRSRIGSSNGIGSQGILMDGTPAQKERWLPKIASGEITASFALTEPESGSDAASLSTSARRDGDHYVVNGVKRFISNAPAAGMFTLLARTDPTDKSARGISAFIVDARTPGLVTSQILQLVIARDMIRDREDVA
jgi:acyl-CoA dehydrogenase